MPDPRLISSETAYAGRLFDVSVDRIEMDGGVVALRETIRHPGAVCMVPVTAEGNLLFVTQYRHAAGRRLLERGGVLGFRCGRQAVGGWPGAFGRGGRGDQSRRRRGARGCRGRGRRGGLVGWSALARRDKTRQRQDRPEFVHGVRVPAATAGVHTVITAAHLRRDCRGDRIFERIRDLPAVSVTFSWWGSRG